MKNRIHSPFHAATATFLLAWTCHSEAQTVYVGPTAGDYATPANWTGGIIPGNGNANGAYIGSISNQSVIYSTATSYTSNGSGGGNRLIVGGPGTTGSLTLSGNAGTLTFGGDQYGNAAWIGSSNSGSSSSGTVTVSAGKLAITGGSEASINLGVLTGGSGTRSGALIINGGTVEVNRRILMGANSTSASGTITISSGTLDMKGTGSNAEGDSGQIRFGAGNNTVNLDGGTLITKGFYISDFANAAGSNIYFNGTTIKANTNNSDFITGGTANAGLRMKSGGLFFDTNGFNVNLNETLSEISGQSAIFRKEGAGTFTITTSQNRTGSTTVNGGTLRVGTGALGTGATTVNNGAILDLDANDVWGNHTGSAQSLTINAGGLVTNGTLTNRGFNGMQSLTINGGELRSTGTARGLTDGSLYKFEAYSIRDTVTIGGSTASLISNPSSIANAGINVGGVTDIGGGAGSSLTFNVADSTASSSTDLTVSAVLKNNYTSGGSFTPLSNGLVKSGSGTMEMTAVNRYTGKTVISQGTLKISGAGSIAASTTVEVGAGAYLDVADVTGGWSLATTQFLQGNGTISGNATIAGTIAPGASIGTLNFQNNLTLGGISIYEINALAMTTDLTSVVDQLGFGGSLVVNNLAGTLLNGMSFDLFDFGSRSGVTEFSSLSLPTLGSGLSWDTSNLYTSGVIAVIPEPTTSGLMAGLGVLSLAIRRRAGNSPSHADRS